MACNYYDGTCAGTCNTGNSCTSCNSNGCNSTCNGCNGSCNDKCYSGNACTNCDSGVCNNQCNSCNSCNSQCDLTCNARCYQCQVCYSSCNMDQTCKSCNICDSQCHNWYTNHYEKTSCEGYDDTTHDLICYDTLPRKWSDCHNQDPCIGQHGCGSQAYGQLDSNSRFDRFYCDN